MSVSIRFMYKLYNAKAQNVNSRNEIKAAKISNADKNKFYRSLNKCYKFGIIIHENGVLDRIFESKKDRQRYLGYAYKIGVKRALQNMINQGQLNPVDVDFTRNKYREPL